MVDVLLVMLPALDSITVPVTTLPLSVPAKVIVIVTAAPGVCAVALMPDVDEVAAPLNESVELARGRQVGVPLPVV